MDARQEFMKVAEIAQELRIARSRAYELLAADGTIPAAGELGPCVRFTSTGLGRWREGHGCLDYKAPT